MGILLLVDLAVRAGDLGAMYTDTGMFSRSEICQRVPSFWNWSFHFGGGSSSYQAGLFALAAVFSLAFTFGFKTRLATIGAWLMLISLQHRVPPVLSGADILLRMLLFWGIFLPLGKIWSADACGARRRNATPPDDAPVLSVGSAAILLQMGMMYLFSALFKSNMEWLRGGVIIASLEHDFYAKPLGEFFLQFPGTLKAMTYFVFALEWLAPILLFLPWRNSRIRLAVVAALAAMHLGIAFLLEVDFFSFVALAGLVLFLPNSFWVWISHRARNNPMPQQNGSTIVPPRRHSPIFFVAQGACAVALVYVVFVNLSTLPFASSSSSAPKPGFLRTGLGLGQKWNMFDEAPSKSGWYVATAQLRDGTNVDLLRNGESTTFIKPQFPAARYPNHRWRKLFREMAYEDVLGYQFFRVPVAAFLCREWNQRKPAEKQIVNFELSYCTQPGASNDSKVGKTERERIAHLDFTDL